MRFATAVAVSLAAASLAAQQPSTRGEFLQLRGKDTVAVERFTRDAQSLAGEYAQRGLHIRYTAQLRADQSVEHFEFTAEREGVTETGRLDFTPTGIRGERTTAGVVTAVDVATRTAALPLFNGSAVLLEQVVRATRPPGRDINVPVFRLFVAPPATDTILLRPIDRDSVLVLALEGELHLAVTADGAIHGVSGLARGMRLDRTPPSSVDLAGRYPRTPPPSASFTSPEMHPDRTVTFRLEAPKATQVTVSVDGNRRPLMKDSTGVWSTTVGPLTADLHMYRFTVDGTGITDPLNPSVGVGADAWTQSLLDLTGDGLPWSLRAVPHGSVTEVWYHSKAFGGAFRSVKVYTPPGYEASTGRFPVLYLLHGASGTESKWVVNGRANLVLDNLIADGKARPMIVVMPYGHGGQNTSLGLGNAGEILSGSTFGEDLLGEVMPMIEQRFRVSGTADERAIAGLSMGGVQAIEIGLTHLDRFHWIAGFSSALYTFYSSFPVQRRLFSMSSADGAAMNKELKLLWIACGKDDGLLAASQRFVRTMEGHGIHATFVVTDGSHEWPVWRRNLAELVPLLFRN